MLGSQELPLWWGINASIPKIIGVGYTSESPPRDIGTCRRSIPLGHWPPSPQSHRPHHSYKYLSKKLKNTNATSPWRARSVLATFTL